MQIRKPVIRSLAECAALALLAGAITSPAWAMTQYEMQKLLASDGAPGDTFGSSVAVDKDTAVIGASDSAYVFIRGSGGSWTEEQKLTTSDGEEYSFGSPVAVDGDTILIGGADEDERGLIYVFMRSSGGIWTEQQKFTASDVEGLDRFGEAIAMDKDTAVIGAWSNDDNGPNSGSAYVFKRGSAGVWTEQQKLTASDAERWARFGESVAVDEDEDTAIIGASSSAYVFMRSSEGVWAEQQNLPVGGFDSAVAIDGHTIVVGDNLDNDIGDESGAVYVFTHSSAGIWTEQQKLIASDGEAWDQFGSSVAVDGDTVVIGAWDDDNGESSGSVYVFTRSSAAVWTEQKKLLAIDAEAHDWFGSSVAVDGDTGMIGAFGDDDNGFFSGSAYVVALVTNVHIDIKPHHKRNKINPRSRGRIWVAILSDTGPESPFDPLSLVDIPTVEFGPDGAKAKRYKVKDINKDGLGDLLLRFKIRKTGIACRDTEATLIGKTFDGLSFTGTDSIKTVGCKPKKCHKKKHYDGNYHDDKRHQGN